MTISEVSKKTGLPQGTLRYYEQIGLIPFINRQNGIRNYSERNCRWIEAVKHMRNAGMPVEALIKYVVLFQKGDETIPERKALFIEQREILKAKMEDMKKTIERLDYKIEIYEKTIAVKEKEFKEPEDLIY